MDRMEGRGVCAGRKKDGAGYARGEGRPAPVWGTWVAAKLETGARSGGHQLFARRRFQVAPPDFRRINLFR